MPMRNAFLRYMIVMLSIFAVAVAVGAACLLGALLLLPGPARVAVPAALLAWLAASLWYVRRPLAAASRKKTQ